MAYSLHYLLDKNNTKISSENDGRQKGYILLPENTTEKKYPVLYLIHGLGGYEEWRKESQGNIVNNINAWENNFDPMVIVMPNIKYYKYSLGIKTFRAFSEFIPSLIDEVNGFYSKNILSGSNNTAIAGFSLGGAAALYYSMLYNDKFLHTGAFSPSACIYYEGDPTSGWITSKDEFVLNNGVNSVQFIGYGENDFADIKKASELEIAYFNTNYEKNPDKYPVPFMNRYIPGDEGKIVFGKGHEFATFNELLRRFLSVNIFGEHKQY